MIEGDAIKEEYRYGAGISRRKLSTMEFSYTDYVWAPFCLMWAILMGWSVFDSGWGQESVASLLFDTVMFLVPVLVLCGYVIRILAPLEDRRYIVYVRNSYLVEIDRWPDAPPSCYHREFITVRDTSIGTIEAAIESVCESEGVDREQILHARELELVDTCIDGYHLFGGAKVWFDESVVPVRSYSMSEYKSYSFYHPLEESDRDLIHHSIAGFSNHSTVRRGERTYPEIIAHHELHELVHWALDQHEQPRGLFGDVSWNAVLWDAQDYVTDEQPDGPWFGEERRNRIEITRRND